MASLSKKQEAKKDILRIYQHTDTGATISTHSEVMGEKWTLQEEIEEVKETQKKMNA